MAVLFLIMSKFVKYLKYYRSKYSDFIVLHVTKARYFRRTGWIYEGNKKIRK